MSSELPKGTAGSPRTASEGVRDCSHLIALLADQMEALEQGDHPRLRELGMMTRQLAGEMQAGDGGNLSLLAWIVERLEEGLTSIEGWTEADSRSRDELSQLQELSLPLVRGLRRRPGSGNYLTLEPGTAKLDVLL